MNRQAPRLPALPGRAHDENIITRHLAQCPGASFKPKSLTGGYTCSVCHEHVR